MRVFDRIDTRNLNRRQWELWRLALTVILILIIGIVLLMYPAVSSSDLVVSRATKLKIFFGFCALALLLVSYLVDRQVVIRQLRNRLEEERKQAEQALQHSLEQLRALTGRLENIREEERKLVAREIHDQPGQALTAIKIDLCALVREMGGDLQHPSKRVSSLLKLVDETTQSVRRIATALRPGILDDLGLVAAIEWAGEDFEARTGTKCRLDLPQESIAIDPERATAIFRILQETLTNVARHAAASEVEVQLGEKDKELTLLVHDNGKGMPADRLSSRESLGILGCKNGPSCLEERSLSRCSGNGDDREG